MVGGINPGGFHGDMQHILRNIDPLFVQALHKFQTFRVSEFDEHEFTSYVDKINKPLIELMNQKNLPKEIEGAAAHFDQGCARVQEKFHEFHEALESMKASVDQLLSHLEKL